MTTQKLFKRRVRARAAKTGESYTAARRHVATFRDRLQAAAIDLSGAFELASDEKVREATGRDWQSWINLLDGWGARQRTRRQLVDFLLADQAVPAWYAQAIASGYERVRGKRLKHQQSDGFTVYASKTVAVPLAVLFAAFADDDERQKWLTDGAMSLRSSQPGKVARFDWADGEIRVMATFEDKGPAKSTVAITIERLPDPAAAEAAKADWKPRLAKLKAYLEPTWQAG